MTNPNSNKEDNQTAQELTKSTLSADTGKLTQHDPAGEENNPQAKRQAAKELLSRVIKSVLEAPSKYWKSLERAEVSNRTIAIATVIIAIATWLTYLEVRSGSTQTDRIIQADERVANALEGSLAKSQQAFEATTKQAVLAERAWLNVFMDSVQGDGKSKFDANRPFRTRITISPDFTFGRDSYRPNGTIPPDGTFFTDFDIRELPPGAGEAINKMFTRVYFYGRTEYKDAFSVDHWVTFCRFLLPGGAYQICAENNDIDQNPN